MLQARRTLTLLIRLSARCRSKCTRQRRRRPVTITMARSASAHRHYGGHQLASARADKGPLSNRGSRMTHIVRDSSGYSAPLICPEADSQGVSESDPGLMFGLTYSNPPPTPDHNHHHHHHLPTAQASSYQLICPDGKWAYCMWGSQGFMLVNGKLEGFQCI